jgi:hypothetical protein
MSDSLELIAWAVTIFLAYVLAQDEIEAFIKSAIQRWRNRRNKR